MAMMLGALYDALMNPGKPETAQKAAEEVADYERKMTDIRSELSVIKWMVATLVAFSIANLWLTMSILSRLPR